MTKALILAALISASCGTDNDVNVKGGTRNELVIRHEMPICEDPVFNTKASKLLCIEAVTSQTMDVEILAENLSADQIDAILQVGN